jgi:hypothetical protein
MDIRNGACGIGIAIAFLAASGSSAQAQWAGRGTAIVVDFSGRGGTQPSFAAPILGRHASLPSQVAALSSVPMATTDMSAFPQSSVAHNDEPQSSLLQHVFLAGIADLVRGEPAEAAKIFAATASATDQVPQLTYLTALALVLSDFDRRDQALPLAKRIVAKNPDHALYNILTIFANRDLSLLRPDGALYFTAAGAKQLDAATARLLTQTDAYNGTYLAALLASIEKTGDTALPERLAGFGGMLGQGRSLKLAGIDTPQALGRLFVLSIPPEALARGEAHFLAGLTDQSGAMATSAASRGITVADRGSIPLP